MHASTAHLSSGIQDFEFLCAGASSPGEREILSPLQQTSHTGTVFLSKAGDSVCYENYGVLRRERQRPKPPADTNAANSNDFDVAISIIRKEQNIGSHALTDLDLSFDVRFFTKLFYRDPS